MLGVGPHGVFVDANVLYSRTLRDWLGLLYTLPEYPLFQVYWSEDVLAETLYNLRRSHPEWPGVRLSPDPPVVFPGVARFGLGVSFSVQDAA